MKTQWPNVVSIACLLFLSVIVWVAIALMLIATTESLLKLLDIILKLAGGK